MSPSRIPNFLIALCLAILATYAAWGFFTRGTLDLLESRFYDVGLTLDTTPRKPQNIVILGIDERFMQGRHAYLAPRDRVAKLIRIVASGKPRAIALDVWLDSHIDEGPNGVDAQLRSALLFAKESGIPVILSDLPAKEIEVERDSLDSLTAHGTVLPFFKMAARSGNVVFVQDASNGAVRWHQEESTNAPSLPLQMARLTGAKDLDESRLQREGAPIDFCGPPGTIARQSAADFLEVPYQAPILENQFVFIGATYPRSQDVSLTPYSVQKKPQIYGVELLAQATDSLRRGAPRHSHQTPQAIAFDFGLVFVTSILVVLAALRGTLAGMVSALILGGLAIAAAVLSARDVIPFWAFRYHNATPFLMALPLAASGGIAWRSLVQARELKRVRDTFSAYVGNEVLEALGDEMPELGGETRSIAVLFCDIRGYSALAETMTDNPSGLLDELNGHFAPLVAALKKRGAYVDNYVGDLVMALFGAPFSQGSFQTDVRASVMAALGFIHLVNQRNQLRRQNGQTPIEIGIGVHCGEAVVGNLGSTDQESGGKIHYTAIGDVVNVASRIESATRSQNVDLLVTREVVEACGQGEGMPTWNIIGSITVKGRKAPVEIFAAALSGTQTNSNSTEKS